MDRSFLLKLVLFIEIMILLGSAVAISRDYQDSWVLEGLEIPFVLFAATYAFAFFSEKKLPSMVLLAIIGRTVFLLIPTLKYCWFQGTAIDQHIQYALANHVYTEGYIATHGSSLASIYSSTPLIHLTFSIFSTILTVPVAVSIKFIPILLSPLFPLLTYVTLKKLKFSKWKTALKYAIFISSVPISAQKFIVTGSQFGVLLAFTILGSLVIFLQKTDRRHLFIFIFLIFALAATHSPSSLLLTVFLVIVMLLQKVPYFRLKSYLKAAQISAVVLICVVWLYFPAEIALERLSYMIFVSTTAGTTPQAETIPLRFFELLRIDILAATKAFLVIYGANIFLLLLTIAGLLVLFKKLKQIDNTLKLLFLVCAVVILFMPIALVLQLGLFRVLHFASPLFPVFAGIFILRICKRRKWLAAIIFSLIMVLATIQFYKPQPLIPSAKVLNAELPASEPLTYVTYVNSIYQRQMIEFAGNHIHGPIACDRITQNQIVGLTDFNYSVAYIKGYYPLDENQLRKRYDYFLIHLPGPGGPFNEQAEMRTTDLILETIYNSSVIYTNGESYALTFPTI